MLIGLGARRMPVMLVTALAVVAVHSGFAHKEYRFIYPAILLFMVLAAFGLAELTSGAAQWLHRRGMRQGIATALSVAVLAGLLGRGRLQRVVGRNPRRAASARA